MLTLWNPRSLVLVLLFVSFLHLSFTDGTSTSGISRCPRRKLAEKCHSLLRHSSSSPRVLRRTPFLCLTCALPLLVLGFDG
jgi:hypothetical protein